MNTLPNLTGLGFLGITVTNGLRTESSLGKDVCTESIAIDTGAATPVTVRLSRKGT